MEYFVYVTENELKKIYIGYTSNLHTRLQRHNHKLPSKASSFTSKNIGAWKLIYSEKLSSGEEARFREKQLKSSQGRAFYKSTEAQLDRSVS